MTNPYYNPSGNPGTGAAGLSSLIRAEFAAIATGLGLLPSLSGNANKAVVVNGSANGLSVTAGTLALAGNFATTGAFNTTLAQQASITLTLPAVNGTVATLAGTETLTNKTLVTPALGQPGSGDLSNCVGTASGLTAGVAADVSGSNMTTLSGFIDMFINARLNNTFLAISQMAAPGAGTGFRIYVDSADGKLKTVSHLGTITTLANP